MRRTLALTVTGLLIVVLLAGLAIAEAVRPSAWEEELEAYLATVRQTSGDEIVLRSLVRARRPERFDVNLSRSAYGVEAYAQRTIPFPPERVYCALVEQRPVDGPAAQQVLFVALHRDLHYADWIVHKGPCEPFGERFTRALDDMGCPLPTRP